VSKKVLITGGSAGVGFAVAKLMASQGHTVAVTGRSAGTGARAESELKALSPGCFFVQGDAGDEAQGTAAVAGATRRLGRLDVLVSSGAQNPLGPMPFAQMTAEQIESGFRTRVMGRILPVHAAIPLF